MVNANYASSLVSSTWETWVTRQPSDAIFGDIVLFDWLNKNARVTKKGGRKLIQAIRYRKSTAVGSYEGFDQLDITPQEVLTMAEVDWKQYFMTVVMSGREMMLNMGEAELLDLLEERTDQAKTSLADDMNSDMFEDGTGNNNKAITGLAAIVLASGEYAGINRSTDTWWKSVVVPVSGSLAIAGATGIRRVFNDVSNGRGKMTPDALLTTQIIYEAFEATMDQNLRFTTASDGPAIQGFNLKYKNARLFYDDYCQTQTLYLLNSKTLKFVVHGERSTGGVNKKETGDTGDFRLGKLQEPADQDAFVGKGLWMGNLICINPRFNGKMTSITNS